MISFDIATKLPNGIDPTSLHQEITIANFRGLYTKEGKLYILSDDAPTAQELTALDAVFAAHIGTLLTNKRNRKTNVNTRTRALIAAGFVHATKTFSLSQLAQLNWTNMGFNAPSLPYPYRVSTIDDLNYHDFQDAAEMVTAYDIAFSTKATHLTSGATLKKDITAATTQTELDAVVDTR